MTGLPAPVDVERLRPIAAACPGLRLLVVHGSRARGDAHALSDWDFAYVADMSFDPDRLLGSLGGSLHTDRIDLVDLERASALLRYRAARDGIAVFEREPREFERFWLASVDTWCDLAPVLEPAYARVLESIPR